MISSEPSCPWQTSHDVDKWVGKWPLYALKTAKERFFLKKNGQKF